MGLLLGVARIGIRAELGMLRRDFAKAKTMSGRAAQSIGRGVGLAIGAGLAIATSRALMSAAMDAVKAAERQVDAERRLAAVSAQTRQSVGLTTEELKKFAAGLQQATGFADEEILEVMAITSSFKKVSKDTFKRATEAAIDLSRAGFGTLASTAKQLGKALDDPTQSLSRLSRQNLTFSEEQRDLINLLVKSGDQLSAQNIILEEVESRFKGVATAMASSDFGELRRLDAQLGDIKETIGKGIVPAVLMWRRAQMGVAAEVETIITSLGALSRQGNVFESLALSAQLQLERILDLFTTNLPQLVRDLVTAGWTFIKTTVDLMKEEIIGVVKLYDRVGGIIEDNFKAFLDLDFAKMRNPIKAIITDIGSTTSDAIGDRVDSVTDLAKAQGKAWMDNFMEGSANTKILEERLRKMAEDASGNPPPSADFPSTGADNTADDFEIGGQGRRGGTTDIAGFGRSIQQGLLERDDKQDQLIKLQEENNAQQKEISNMLNINLTRGITTAGLV